MQYITVWSFNECFNLFHLINKICQVVTIEFIWIQLIIICRLFLEVARIEDCESNIDPQRFSGKDCKIRVLSKYPKDSALLTVARITKVVQKI